MRILVTGAAGFLGRHITHRLRDEGWGVTGFDLLDCDEPGISWIVGDIRNLDQIRGAAHGQDVICHVGAVGDVYAAADNPSLAAAVNVTGSAHVAEAALAAGAKVIYASTWEVYGQPRYEPVDEDHPCQPDHPYNVTKLAGEQLLLSAGRLRNLPVIALRLGTAYGPGLRSNSVFRTFIDRARLRQPIVIQGDGSQARQFTHASDIATAFALACRSSLSGIALNTVSQEQVSIKQLAEQVIARLPTEIIYSESRLGDVASALVSPERIKSLLGWKAKVPFDAGLDELIDFRPTG